MDIFIGRQAIYNTVFNVDAYELLYRRGSANFAIKNTDGDTMTRSVLSEAITMFGMDQLTNGLPIYVNFTKNLLSEDFALMFDPEVLVIEIPSKMTLDDQLVKRLSNLQSRGYKLCLNSYTPNLGRLRFNNILHLFDIIRVDISQNYNRVQMREMTRRIKFSGAKLLAERVEDSAAFEMAQEMGFSLFQGYYFEMPVCLTKQVLLTSTAYGRLFNQMFHVNLNYETCSRIMQTDAVLAHMFLYRYASSYNRDNISGELRRNMERIGSEEFRHWVAVVVLKQFNTTDDDQMPKRAFMRGRFIEHLMENSEIDVMPQQGFLLGVISLMDTITGAPLSDIVEELTMSRALEDALLERANNYYSLFLNYAKLYESAFEDTQLPNLRLTIQDHRIADLYQRSSKEMDDAFADNVLPLSAIYRGNILRR